MKMAKGLVAAHDIPVGGKLAVEDVAERDMDPETITPSFVKQEDRPAGAGPDHHRRLPQG